MVLLKYILAVGYTIIALEHTIQTKYDPKTHENVFAALLTQLRKRDGILFIKRLTILLDEESDKGNGLVSAESMDEVRVLIQANFLEVYRECAFTVHIRHHCSSSDDSKFPPVSLPDSLPTIPPNCTHHLPSSHLASTSFSHQAYTCSNCHQERSCLRDKLLRSTSRRRRATKLVDSIARACEDDERERPDCQQW